MLVLITYCADPGRACESLTPVRWLNDGLAYLRSAFTGFPVWCMVCALNGRRQPGFLMGKSPRLAPMLWSGTISLLQARFRGQPEISDWRLLHRPLSFLVSGRCSGFCSSAAGAQRLLSGHAISVGVALPSSCI